jgi:hypothetical protein
LLQNLSAWPELQEIINTWPKLSRNQKAQVLGIIRGKES